MTTAHEASMKIDFGWLINVGNVLQKEEFALWKNTNSVTSQCRMKSMTFLHKLHLISTMDLF